MAPANGATSKPGQGLPRRSATGTRKPVVPVIPLAYLQPQRRNQPAALSVQSSLNDRPARNEPANNRDQTDAQPNRADSKLDEPGRTTEDYDNSKTTTLVPQNEAQPSKPEAVTPSATTVNTVTAVNDGLATPPSAPSSKKGTDTPTAHNPAAHVQQTVTSPTPTRHRAGPLFHAVNGSQHHHHSQPGHGFFTEPGTNHVRPPSLNQASLHQAHPSNGSLIFGGLHSSDSSSPVPIGGGVQPPSSMSYPSEDTAAPGLDRFGRPFHVSPGFDGFPPDALPPPGFNHRHPHHGPPTPHSFHGSQSSTHADEGGYPNFPSANSRQYSAHPAGQAQRHMATMSLDPQPGVHYRLSNGPAPTCAVTRPQAQTLEFLRDGVDRAEFSDCTLELHLANPHQPRDGPLLVNCHRLIISQSPVLNQILRSRDIPAGGRLVLEVQDQYVRPDSFHFTLRTLYGWDLGDGPLPPFHPQRSVEDSFDLALGYAASASYLKLPFVYAKGIHHASHQLHWDTIEKACQFALPSAVFGHPLRLGISSSPEAFTPFVLIDAIMAFLVHNIPANFVLDVNASDCGFSRLPRSSTSGAPGRVGPGIAHGASGSIDDTQHNRHGSVSHAHMPRTSRLSVHPDPRLSSIQFGDLSVANGRHVMPDGQTKAAASRPPSHVDTILSRILLNLPFSMLKQVLEHPGLAQLSGDLGPASRLELISSVVAEREARRLATLNKGDPQLRVFVEKLESAAEPLVVQQMGDFMVNSMGFKEEVFPGDVPYLVQTWITGSGSVGP